MSRKADNLGDFGRFTEPAVLILVSLAEQPRHGYAISDDIEQFTGYRPGPGTLYGALARLESRGFIRQVGPGGKRSTYRLTPEGLNALRARLNAMSTVTTLGLARLAT